MKTRRWTCSRKREARRLIIVNSSIIARKLHSHGTWTSSTFRLQDIASEQGLQQAANVVLSARWWNTPSWCR